MQTWLFVAAGGAIGACLRFGIAELMALHYDPLYARSQSANLFDWAERQTVCADDLTPAGIALVADQVLALEAQ